MALQYLPHSAMASVLQSSNPSGLYEVNHAEISVTESGSWPSVFTYESPSCIHGKYLTSLLFSTLQKVR